MKIEKPAIAGTMESSDAMVRVEPLPGQGLQLEIESIVIKQFGEAIRALMLQTLAECDVTEGYVSVVDQGALDCTLKARLQTALQRAGGNAE